MDSLVLGTLFFALYFLPTIIAMSQNHHQKGPVFIINFFLGWTLIGWVVALAMSVSATTLAQQQEASTRACPFCAEYIQPTAIVCRHCGRDLPPLSRTSVVTDPKVLASEFGKCSHCNKRVRADAEQCPFCGIFFAAPPERVS